MLTMKLFTMIFLLTQIWTVNCEEAKKSPSASTSMSTSVIPSTITSTVTSKTPSASATVTSKTPSASTAVTSKTPSVNTTVKSKTPSANTTVTSKTPSANTTVTSKTPSASTAVTSKTPSASTAMTSKTQKDTAVTSETLSTTTMTSETPSASASTTANETPSTNATVTSETSSASTAVTSKTPSRSTSTTRKTPSKSTSVTSKTPSTSASMTSELPSTSASMTSEPPSTSASMTSEPPSTSASMTSEPPSTSASMTSEPPSTSASMTSEPPSTNTSLTNETTSSDSTTANTTVSTSASTKASKTLSTSSSNTIITHNIESTTETAEHREFTTQTSHVTTELHTTEGKLVVAEVYYHDFHEEENGTDICDFVELYGDASMDLSNYTLIFFDEKKEFLSVSLTNYTTNANGSFVIAVTNGNSSCHADLEISHSIYRLPVTVAAVYKVLKSHLPSLNNVTGLLENGVLLDYVAYGDGSDVPVIIKNITPGLKTIKKTDKKLQESISRCFSAEPMDQRAFKLSCPTPGFPNDCIELDLKISEIKYAAEGDNNSCYIELKSFHNSSLSLNSYVVVIYTINRTSIFDLWNMRTDSHGYFLLVGSTLEMADVSGQGFLCKDIFVNGTMAIILYQIPVESTLVAPLSKENIKQQVAFSTFSPIDKDLLMKVMDQDLTPLYKINFTDNALSFLSGNMSLSWCSSSYLVLPPTPAHANNCPVMTTLSAQRTTIQQSTNVLINEITISSDGSEQFIELKGDKFGNLQSYYLALYDGCNGSMISTLNIKKNLDKNGFLKLDTSVYSDMDFSKHLKQGDTLAIGLYQQKPSSISKTNSLVDAVAMMSSDHRNCGNPPKAKVILANNSTIITISSDEMNHLISLSRCSSNSRRQTEEFKVLKQSSPGSDNIGCNPNIKPTHSKKNKQTMVTIAVVLSCIVLFLIIVVFVVVIMKRKKRGLQHFSMARLNDDDDDDEELITNMDPVDDLTISAEPTFQSQVYSKLRVKDDDDVLLQI